MNKKSLYEEGFSLYQLLITVIIVSVGLTASIKLAYVEFQERREKKIIESFENINDLLLAYYTGVDENGDPIRRLPCPARQDLPINSPDFGKENCSGATVVTGNVPHPDTGTNMRVMIGALPTKELSMPTKEAFDVFGGQILYAVSRDLTKDTNFLRHDMSAIQRLDDSGTLAGQPLPYMLVSMGESNKGAYSTGGVLLAPCEASERDSENCDNGNATFLDAFVAEEHGSTGFFDDRVSFDGKFFSNAGQFIVLNFECPEDEVLRGMKNGEPICTAMEVVGGGGGGGTIKLCGDLGSSCMDTGGHGGK